MGSEVKSCCLTFDIDLLDYLNDSAVDEIEEFFYEFQKIMKVFPNLKTTWFIRIDSQIETLFGSSEYILYKHMDKIKWLQNSGHEIGWHHHAYSLKDGIWKQNTDLNKVCNEIEKYGKIAIKHGMKAVRMGWGYQTNETMALLNHLGFLVDSSAIPRPNYRWDLSTKDWAITPQYPYKPSTLDYRVGGLPELNILEVPITTIPLSVSTDTEKVMRYINPAYHSDYFTKALEEAQGYDMVVLICHPYEVLKNSNTHSLLSFDLQVFRHNIEMLYKSNMNFYTISEVVGYL